MLSKKFEEAFLLANNLHKNQTRNRWPAPYICHPIGVASLVLEYHGNENEAIAGLLHDVLEDQWYPNLDNELLQQFGTNVFGFINNCTDWYPGRYSLFRDTKKPEWKLRKENYLFRISTPSNEDDFQTSYLTIAADKLYNIRSIIKDFRIQGKNIFENGRPADQIIWYYTNIIKTFQSINIQLWPVIQELTRTVDEFIDLIQ
jgi:(p)ppGpp synthase/HD superfamily hydrolase